ncbi:MAG: right-handed parallel beta-helix repeat-containing protein [Bdellovibrionota bacterium]
MQSLSPSSQSNPFRRIFGFSGIFLISLLSVLVPMLISSCGGESVPSCSGDTLSVSDSSRSGALTQSEIWSGTINVTGDILLGENCILEIRPGTQVRFANNSDVTGHGFNTPITDSSFPNDPAKKPSEMSGIELWGGPLNAEGSRRASITFTSDAGSPTAGDWHSIAFRQAGSKLILKNVVVEYGYYGIQISAAAGSENVQIQNNTIREAVGCGLCTGDASATYSVAFTISGNTFEACGHEGVDTHSNATLTIDGNTFADNRGKFVGDPHEVGGNGVVVDRSPSIIRNNTFVRNNQGIACVTDGSNPTIESNTFGTAGDANDENIQNCPR